MDETILGLGDSVEKTKTDWERVIANYDRWQRRKKQNKFERFNTVSVSRLGFDSIDDLTQAIVDRLSEKFYSHQVHSDFARRGRDLWKSQGITITEIMRLPPDKMYRLIGGALTEIYGPSLA